MGKKKGLKYTVFVALAFWVFMIAAGWFMLSKYENTPGKAQSAPQRWPPHSRLAQTPGMPTLLMFVHPHCPCTRASIGELALIMTHCRQKLTAKVIFIRPAAFPEDWVKTDLWRSAGEIPGVETIADDKGAEARIFQARVSGQVMLYDRQGNLVFSGGITSSRGHSGDNLGRDAIEAFLNKGVIVARQTPFFGCWLFSDESNKSSGGV